MAPVSKSMPRWLTALLGASLLAGIAVLVWQLRAEPERPKRGATASAQPGSRPAPRGQLSPPAKPGEPEVEDAPVAGNSVADTSAQYLEKLFSRTVPNRIMRAVSGCYSGEAGQFERMAIDFTIEFSEGVAMLSEVVVTKSANHPQLEECAADVMRALTWQQSRAPNMVRKEQIEISVNDLVKRHKQFVRQDEEEN